LVFKHIHDFGGLFKMPGWGHIVVAALCAATACCHLTLLRSSFDA